MKFAHLSDVHIGGWREDQLKQLNLQTFRLAIDKCIENRVAFILISGDLFDTALPPIELIREVSAKLREAKEQDIDIYVIPGSHDFSPSNKTMIDVLEKTGLLENVCKFHGPTLKFTHDKTGAKITGLLGKRGGLEKFDYEKLNKEPLEKEDGFKIFMFHTLLNELKPKDLEMVEGCSLLNLPKNFNYYAGGHPHFVFAKEFKDYGLITYPGALFPNNFKELEKFNHGGFYLLNYSDNKLTHQWIPVKIKDVLSFSIDINHKDLLEIEKELNAIEKEDIKDKIITIRISGMLESGKLSDIKLREAIENLYGEGAYCVLKNTAKLTTKEFEEIKVDSGNVDEIEEKIIKAHIGQVKLSIDEEKATHALMRVLSQEKLEGEKNFDFESRVLKSTIKILKLEESWK